MNLLVAHRTGMPSDPGQDGGRDDEFWYQIRLNVTTALVIAGGSAIVWIGYKVPLQLDAILDNQKEQAADIVRIESKLDEHDRRLTNLEVRP